jgi:hypothetical protein
MVLDFVPEGGWGTICSMSRSRLRTFAIEIWHRFDLDNFQAFIDRRNSSARKLIMHLKQELASRLTEVGMDRPAADVGSTTLSSACIKKN